MSLRGPSVVWLLCTVLEGPTRVGRSRRGSGAEFIFGPACGIRSDSCSVLSCLRLMTRYSEACHKHFQDECGGKANIRLGGVEPHSIPRDGGNPGGGQVLALLPQEGHEHLATPPHEGPGHVLRSLMTVGELSSPCEILSRQMFGKTCRR